MSHATSDNDNACVSIMPQSEAGGSSSNSSRRKRKSENGTVFRAWSFQLMVKTDLCHGSTAVEKEKLLREQLSARTEKNIPPSVTGVAVFCNRLLFSQPPDSDGLVSIEVHGYVQANHAKPQSTMKKWIDSSTWKPVPGGLTSDNEYMSNIRRLEDPNDEWTRLMLLGSIGANNVGRSEQKAAKQQSLGGITNRHQPVHSRPASNTSLSRGSASTGASSPVCAYFSRIRRERPPRRRNRAEINR
jgi:hypothetical protein